MPATGDIIQITLIGERDRLVSVSGELDLHSVHVLEQALNEAIEFGSERVVVNLSEVKFIDSIALGVLTGSARRLRETGGSLGITATNPEIVRPFEITGLDRVIPLEASVTETLERLAQSS